jgi:hypothetical protein
LSESFFFRPAFSSSNSFIFESRYLKNMVKLKFVIKIMLNQKTMPVRVAWP